MLLTALFLGLAVLVSPALSLYGPHTDVIELTPANFKSKVLDSNQVWIVEFYAPWCGHCRAFTPEYSKAATALKGIVNVGAVDADTHQSLGSQYGVRGFPTVKVFGLNKQSPQDYQGARTAQGLVDQAMQELRRVINTRMGSGQRSEGGSAGTGKKADDKDVVELTDSNFKETVLDSEDMWLVEFFAPWCPHCKNLAPEWAKAATELKGKVKLGAVDSTVHTIISGRYNIKGYPTIKFFPAGKKDGTADEYDGGRTASDIVAWALDKFAQNAPPPEVKQITSLDDVKEACEEHQICILSVLPHILDCQSQCRNDYLKILKTVSEKYKRHRWGWVWAEALAQPELEDALGIGGFGYPAMAAVNIRKMKYSLLRGSFSDDGISEFVREVSVGRGSSIPIKGAKIPEIRRTEPWDGKDGVLPVEEEVDDDLPEDEMDQQSSRDKMEAHSEL